MQTFNYILLAATIALLIPVSVFCIECVLSLIPRRRRETKTLDPRPSVVVLMPAHNEEAGIAESIKTITAQFNGRDRLIVVADNCSDRTAAVARELGVVVIERVDQQRRGKGYALDFGVQFMQVKPPEVVIIMDSDCIAEAGMIDALVAQVVATNRPAQAIYLMEHAKNPTPRDLVSALAFTVKNQVRPTGLARLQLPCLLTGTGMAFPWEVIRDANLASGNIVEDMQLGVDLTLARKAPRLCEAARVTGRLPENATAVAAQRRRWEHGHLHTLLTQVPRLCGRALVSGNLGAAAIAMDLAVPPLSLLMAIVAVGAFAASVMAVIGASWLPAAALGLGFVAIAGCVIATWAKFARKTLPLRTLVAAPFYLLWKIPISLAYVVRRQQQWNRTDRTVGQRRSRRIRAERRRQSVPDVRSMIQLANVAVDAVTESECIEFIMSEIEQGNGGVVITPNLDHLRRCARDPEYATMLNAADLVLADGMPLVWASKLQGTPLPARVAGSDLISSLSAAATGAGRSIYLLGGSPGTADATATVLRERHPDIRLVGVYCPPLGFEDDAEVLPEMLEKLRAAKPDIVFVALGSPKQERLISVLRDKFPLTWWLGVGYSFSFLSGEAKRAPMWMQHHGLEWAHRLMQDPKRLAKRYLYDDLPFAASLMGGAAMNRVSNWFGHEGEFEQDAAANESLSIGNVDLPAPSSTQVEAGGPKIIYQSFLSDLLTESVAAKVDSIQSNLRVRSLRAGTLDRLKGVMVLSGSVRPTPLSSAIGRSILDLPLEDGRSLLTHWHSQVRDLRRSIGATELPLVVMVDKFSPIPLPPPRQAQVPIRIERDRSAYRGTGGVLRDFALDFEDDDFILVASAAQALIRPLPELSEMLSESAADISFIAPRDETPSGMMLIRCKALRVIAGAGYVDLKEQALPEIAKRFDVRPLHLPTAVSLPMRSLNEYLAALQYRHRLADRESAGARPFAEEQCRSFSVIEKGAVVHPTARIHDAVVLRNARVGADAVVVRSVVCPGGVLNASATAVDELVLNEVAA